MLLGLYCIRVPSLFVLGSFGPPAARGTRSGRTAEQRDELAPFHVEHGASSLPACRRSWDDDQPRPNALQWLCTINLPQRGAWDRPCGPRLTHCDAAAMGLEVRGWSGQSLPAAGQRSETLGSSSPSPSLTNLRRSWAQQQRTVTSDDVGGQRYAPTAFAQGAPILVTLPLVLTILDMSRADAPAHCTSRSNNNLEL
jgi:hypothetical protein